MKRRSFLQSLLAFSAASVAGVAPSLARSVNPRRGPIPVELPVVSLPKGEWAHVAFVRANGLIRVYMNSARVADIEDVELLMVNSKAVIQAYGRTIFDFQPYASTFRKNKDFTVEFWVRAGEEEGSGGIDELKLTSMDRYPDGVPTVDERLHDLV